MPDLTFALWLVVFVSGFCTGMGKSGFGGVGMVALILMAAAFPARESTGLLLPMLITADLFAVWRFRRYAVWRHILRILPPALTGVVIGWWVMPDIPDSLFGPVIGWILLLMIALLVLMKTLPALRNVTLEHQALLIPTGLTAGITTMLANAAGPVATLYLLACRLPKMEFVGTGAWFFLIVNVFKIPFSAQLGLITSESLLINLAAIPSIFFGIAAGRWLLTKISQRLFEVLLLIFATLGAIRLIAF